MLRVLTQSTIISVLVLSTCCGLEGDAVQRKAFVSLVTSFMTLVA
jgi:hypothetical protein